MTVDKDATVQARRPAGGEDRLSLAIAAANIPTLLMCLVQMTGDLKWLEPPYHPARGRGLDDNDSGGLPVDVQDHVRAHARRAFQAWMEGTPLALPAPDHALLARMLSVAMGEPVAVNYGELIASELRLDDAVAEPVAGQWPAGFHALIVGAGVSGLCAAKRFVDAGMPFVIVEKNDTVGGTWLENRYPGCGVDTPSHLYSYSFASHDWSSYFSRRDELQAYLESVTTRFDLHRHIMFQSQVLSMVYEASNQRWAVRIRRRDGSIEMMHPNIVVTGVGAFRNPKFPNIPGLGTFAGPVYHTAQWPADANVEGKRVAVIGNGASAMQLVPAIAGIAKSVTVFQRSPQWAAPFEKFNVLVPEPVRWLLTEVPLYRAWYRVRLGWVFNDRTHPALQKDPKWPHPERSVNAINDGYRKALTRYIEAELGDRHDLRNAVVPRYPPFGKRMLLDNGWFRTLTRDDVKLVTEPISEIGTDCVMTADGHAYEADVLVAATGFDVVRFLANVEIRGRSGRTLTETWDDDNARAFLGLAVPDFPNLFILYGPNLQTGHGGSLIFLAECQVHYLMSLLAQMSQRHLGSAECRQEVFDRYNAEIDSKHAEMIWTHPGMDTYYRNSRGRVVVNTPFRVSEFWHLTRTAKLGEWAIEPAGTASAISSPVRLQEEPASQ